MPDASETDAVADKYLTAVELFCQIAEAIPPERLDFRPDESAWSAREVAFHAAEVDQNLGIRLRRILTEDYPELAGVNLPAWVSLLRKAQLDIALALDSLCASSALNVALMESLDETQLLKKGRHSEGHDMTVRGLCIYMALHLESHVRQLGRLRASWQSAGTSRQR